MSCEMASLVFFAADADQTATFYRTVGIPLEDELHEDGALHFACELGPVHVAVYAGEQPGETPDRRAAGSTFPGLYVDSLETVEAAVTNLGATILTEHEQMEWGCRFVVLDPDGRPVEINQRDHC